MSSHQGNSALPQAITALLDRQQSLESTLSECTALLRHALEEHGAGTSDGAVDSATGWLNPMVGAIQHGADEGEVVEATVNAVQYLLPDAAGAVSLITESASTSLVAAWRGGRQWSGFARGATGAGDEALLHELSRESLEHSVRVILSGLGMTVGELRIWPGGNSIEPQTAQLRTLAGIAGVALAGFTLKQRLRHRSVRDAQTGLFNHRYMEDTLERELHRARRNQGGLGLILVELQALSAFAARHGQDTADQVLEAAAGVLQASFRGSDICCRYAEQRLCVVMPDANVDGTARRAEALHRELRELKVIRRGETLQPPGIAVGIAAYPTHADNPAELMRAAEQAVERAGEPDNEGVKRAQRVQ
ncbi:diguanylate cyclase [Ectothiorhodospiraceae bacterium WFHF3C12]|nr:diguanylate cyclase [Ectothiorhodospiraceae bacterium WFHF3C12]